MGTHSFVTIPKNITGSEELVVLPRKVLDSLLMRRVSEQDVLRWSREAKKMKKAGKLPVLHSLSGLR